jgi:hypothetical protein
MAMCGTGANCLTIYYYQVGAVAGTVAPGLPFYVGAELWQSQVEIDGEILDWYITPSLTDNTILAQGTALSAPRPGAPTYAPNVAGLPYPGFPVLHVRYPGNGTLPATVTYVGNINVKGTDGCVTGATQLCPDGVTVMANCVNGGWIPTDLCGVLPPTCRDQHPVSECLSDYLWDCVGESWQDTGVFCGVIPPTCRDDHPTSECLNGYTWDCVNDQWVNTNAACGAVPCLTTHPNEECINGYVWDCVNNEWVQTVGVCDVPAPNNTLLYIGVGAAALLGVVLLVGTGKKR